MAWRWPWAELDWCFGAKLAEASEAFQQSLLICRKIGHQGQITGRLAGLVRVVNDQGEYDQAQRWGNEALTIARPLGSPVYLAHILYSLGETAYKTDNFPAAHRYLMEAISVTAKANLHAYLLITLFHYTQLLFRESKAKPGLSEQNDEEKQTKAFMLFTLVQNHPACWQVYKARSVQSQAALATQLPPPVLAAAKAHTDNHTLDQIVAEILESSSLGV